MKFLAAFLFASMPALALAQTTTGTTVDLSFWLQLILGIASISIPVVLSIIAAWAKSHFNIANDSNSAATIDLAVTAGSQFAAAEIAKAPTTASVNVKDAAIADFVSTLSTGTQAAMKLRGTTAATVAQRIDGAVQMALTPPVVVAPVAVAEPAKT